MADFKLNWEGEKLTRRIVNKGEKVLDAIAKDALTYISQKMNEPKTGTPVRKIRNITKQKGRQQRRASAPGEFPAVQRGRLLRSMVIAKSAERELARSIIARAKHGWYLEYGTRKIKPRPFMRPTLEKFAPELERRMKDLL